MNSGDESGPFAETLTAGSRSSALPEPIPRRSSEALERLINDGPDALVIEGVLGEGGMGIVHLATQTSLGRKVAVKMLRPGHHNRADAVTLLREATITGALEHPNIPPVYWAAVKQDGAPQVVLKRIEGVLWHDLIHDEEAARARFDSDDLLVEHLQILLQVCQALRFAHACRVIHCDIKPKNVMLGNFGEVYLLDWGVAVELDDPEQVVPKQLVGTPAYIAPEMFSQEALSVRSDIYLLGGCLHELLCGQPPHETADLGDISPPDRGRSFRFPEHVSEGIANIARRALAPDPADRFESAEAFRHAVASYLVHRDSERVAQEALRQLKALVAAAARRSPDAVEKRVRMSQAFGACTFGFVEALRTWPDNDTAKTGLLGAYETLIRYEAEEGDAEAAAALMAEMAQFGAVPKRLVDLVSETAEKATQEALRVTKLEYLGRMFDPKTKLRARWILGTLLAVLGGLIPAATQAFVDPSSNAYGPAFVHPGLFLVGTVVFSWLERESLATTAYNRWFLAAVIAGLCGQLLLLVGGALMSLPIVSTTAFIALQWAILAGLLAGALEPRLGPAMLIFLAVFLAIALGAENRLHANALLLTGFLATACLLFVVWRPAR